MEKFIVALRTVYQDGGRNVVCRNLELPQRNCSRYMERPSHCKSQIYEKLNLPTSTCVWLDSEGNISFAHANSC